MGRTACTEPRCLYNGALYLLVPWSRKSTAIPLLPLWAVRSAQSLSACTRVHFTFFTVKYNSTPLYMGIRDSAVVIATCYGLDGPGDRIPMGARFSASVQTGSGTHPASCTMGTRSFPGVKRPRRGADHPTLSSAKVKKE